MKQTLSLTLFFTRHTALADWDKVGMFEREVALYRRLTQRGVKVRFVTYGGRADLTYQGRLMGIDIVCNRWNLPDWLYVLYLASIAPIFWPSGTIFKSNQLKGAEIGLQAARRFGRKFIARCGYLYAEFVENQHGRDSLQAVKARKLEKDVFTKSSKIVVTTGMMRQRVMDENRIPGERVLVIPNYVETERFKPEAPEPHPLRIIFVGRLEEQKNLSSLLSAMQHLNAEIWIVGVGSQQAALEEQADSLSLHACFLGNMPNEDLPKLLNQASLFVLPSHYEGHPKALLEAMACGLPVIGTDVPGIREVIKHGENGWLCGTEPMLIRQAIETVTGNPNLQKRLGENARRTVIDQFSLDRIVELEMNLLEEMSQ